MNTLYSTGSSAKENAMWVGDLSGLADEVIDFDGAWWSGVQDNFVSGDDMQGPLYGLMEPT
jgi:hypothetical protein